MFTDTISKSTSEECVFSRTGKLRRSWQALEFRDGKFVDASESAQIHMLEITKIRANPAQPRKSFNDEAIISLASSIREHGIIQPITVRSVSKSEKDSALFEVIAGERRLRAAKLLGMTRVPCIITEVDDCKSAELSLVENTQREDLNFFEEAAAIAALIETHRLSQGQIAKQLGVSQSFVANKLRILRLSPEERAKILEYGLTERHARALLQISSLSERLEIIEHIRANDLSVAATEAYIERRTSKKPNLNKRASIKRIILKDMRVFYNSVDRAISTIKQAGINVKSERTEENGVTILTIRIPNNVSRETL